MSEAGDNKLRLFEGSQIRTVWDAEKEEWYFSVVDVCGVLSGSNNPRHYWSDLKRKLSKEGATQLYDEIIQLKMRSSDGKAYATDASDTRGILRIIQSVSSPKAELFKRWLAQVGAERIDETVDPELAIDRALETYLAKGHAMNAADKGAEDLTCSLFAGYSDCSDMAWSSTEPRAGRRSRMDFHVAAVFL